MFAYILLVFQQHVVESVDQQDKGKHRISRPTTVLYTCNFVVYIVQLAGGLATFSLFFKLHVSMLNICWVGLGTWWLGATADGDITRWAADTLRATAGPDQTGDTFWWRRGNLLDTQRWKLFGSLKIYRHWALKNWGFRLWWIRQMRNPTCWFYLMGDILIFNIQWLKYLGSLSATVWAYWAILSSSKFKESLSHICFQQ